MDVLPLALHKHRVPKFNKKFLVGIDSAHILDDSPITLEIGLQCHRYNGNAGPLCQLNPQ